VVQASSRTPVLSRYQDGKPCSAIGPTWLSRPSRGFGGVTTVAAALPASGAITASVTPVATDQRIRWFFIGLLGVSRFATLTAPALALLTES
jgi:hypothetical protein